MRYLFLSLLLTCSLIAEDLDSLLTNYKIKSDLSNITKKEAAGLLDIYTRDDLEKMQVHNLTNVLQTISGLYLYRTSNNLVQLGKLSASTLPISAVRIYINNHDLTSGFFGGGFMVWGEMPIEYIDHIEVYKSTSSIEFSNESSILVIKLYTKDPKRDSGTKVRLSGDNLGSVGLDAYVADIEDRLSYFVYAQGDRLNRTVYHNTYLGKEYDFNSDKKGVSVYASLEYEKWKIELSSYSKRSDSFIGIGKYKTPSGGELQSRHSYVHVTKKFDNGVNLQLSYDDIIYDRTYTDYNGINIVDTNGSYVSVEDYDLDVNDRIGSIFLNKEFRTDTNRLYMGAYYKHKESYTRKRFVNGTTGYIYSGGYNNGVGIASAYIEDSYSFNQKNMLVASAKYDYYAYDKGVENRGEYIARLSYINKNDYFDWKLFATRTYLPLAMYQLYNNDLVPYKTNPKLQSPRVLLLSTSLKKKFGAHQFELIVARNQQENIIVYNPATIEGFINVDKTISFNRVEVQYEYMYDLQNKLMIQAFSGDNSEADTGPKTGVNIRLYNHYKKFDFYNELLYKGEYTRYNIEVEDSFNLTSAVKYHYNRDLAVGIRGENLLGNSFEIIYRGLTEPIPVSDTKVWLNVEYVF